MKSIVSLCSVVIVLVLSFLLSNTWMSGKNNRERRMEFRTVIHNSQSFRCHDPWTFVIRNEHEEQGFLSKSRSVGEFPIVDYSNQMVVCLLGGWRQSVDVSITIDSILQKEAGLTVYSHESHPKAQNMVAGYPAHIVVMNKVSSGVIFQPTRIVPSN